VCLRGAFPSLFFVNPLSRPWSIAWTLARHALHPPPSALRVPVGDMAAASAAAAAFPHPVPEALAAVLRDTGIGARTIGDGTVVGPVPLLRPAVADGTAFPSPHAHGMAVLGALGEAELAVGSSCGPSRMGKSAKLSTVVVRLADPGGGHTYGGVWPVDRLELFPTSDQPDALTMGADAFFILRPGSPVAMVVDTEGAGDRGGQYDLKLHVLAVLQATVVLLHCQGTSGRSRVLDQLAGYCRAGAGVSGGGGRGRKHVAVLVSDCWNETTSETERARTFDLEAGEAGEAAGRNSCRRAVEAVFSRRSAIVLPPPGGRLREGDRSMDDVIDGELVPLVRESLAEPSLVPGLDLATTGSRLARSLEAWCEAVASPGFDAENPVTVAAVARRVAVLHAEARCVGAATEALAAEARRIVDGRAWWAAAAEEGAAAVRRAARSAVLLVFGGVTDDQLAAATAGATGAPADAVDAAAVLEACEGTVGGLAGQVGAAVATARQRVVDDAVTVGRTFARDLGDDAALRVAGHGGTTAAGLVAELERCQTRLGGHLVAVVEAGRGEASAEEVRALVEDVVEQLQDAMDRVDQGLARANDDATQRTCRAALFVAERLALESALARAGGRAEEARAAASADLGGLSTTVYSTALPAEAERAAATARAAAAPAAVRALWSGEGAAALAEAWRTSGTDPLPHARELAGDDVAALEEHGPALARLELALSCRGLEAASAELNSIHARVRAIVAENEAKKPPPPPPSPGPRGGRGGWLRRIIRVFF